VREENAGIQRCAYFDEHWIRVWPHESITVTITSYQRRGAILLFSAREDASACHD